MCWMDCSKWVYSYRIGRATAEFRTDPHQSRGWGLHWVIGIVLLCKNSDVFQLILGLGVVLYYVCILYIHVLYEPSKVLMYLFWDQSVRTCHFCLWGWRLTNKKDSEGYCCNKLYHLQQQKLSQWRNTIDLLGKFVSL